VRCFCETDEFAELLMKEMGIENFDWNYDAMKTKEKNKNNDNNEKKCMIF
jgi:hypothetical protein